MRRLPLLALAVLLATGCSASDSASKSGSESASSSAQAGSVGKAAAPEAARSDVVAAQLTTLPRTVVRTAAISVTVPDVPAAADRAVTLALRAGGLVQSDTRSREDKGRASLVLRVPPEDVQATLTGVADLGDETAREASEQDVTEQSVDLASRLATQRASVARVRTLLERANTLGEITSLEGELTRREADLESLQNRSAALAAQVSLATVTVTFTGAGGTPAGTAPTGFRDGLDGGWQALSSSARVLAVVVGAVLPFLPLLLLGLVVRVVWRRRHVVPSAT